MATQFQVGQIVKLVISNLGLRVGSPEAYRVSKIWKNGVVQIETLSGQPQHDSYDVTGYRRGHTSKYGRSYRIEPLADGETPESLLAARQAAANAARAEQEAQATARAAQIQTWWNAHGQHIWAARVTLPHKFFDEEVSVIQYEVAYGPGRTERRMPMVIARKVQRYGGSEMVGLTIGGLHGDAYPTDSGTHKSVSTYSSSSPAADTLEAALFAALGEDARPVVG